LTWLRANHPEWILYHCDRTTVKIWDHTDAKPQIDVSQPEVVAWQLGLLGGESSPRYQRGYNAISIDNFMVDNVGTGACGHFAKNGSWVQQYTGREWDPAWRRDMLGWLRSFYLGLQAVPAPYRPLLILNTDLSHNCNGSCAWDDEIMLTIGNHSDGVLNEGAWGWDKTGHLHLPEDEDAHLWANDIRWANNLQSAGKGYFPDVESINATAVPQSVVTEFDAISEVSPLVLLFLVSHCFTHLQHARLRSRTGRGGWHRTCSERATLRRCTSRLCFPKVPHTISTPTAEHLGGGSATRPRRQ
jgi:hypothetical protein